MENKYGNSVSKNSREQKAQLRVGDQNSNLPSSVLPWNSQIKPIPSFYQLLPDITLGTTMLWQPFHLHRYWRKLHPAPSWPWLALYHRVFLHLFASFAWQESHSDTPVWPGQSESRAYLLQLQQEGDIVALLGREPPVGREEAEALRGLARALLALGRVPLPHSVRAVVGNNLPVPAERRGNLCKVLARSTAGLAGNTLLQTKEVVRKQRFPNVLQHLSEPSVPHVPSTIGAHTAVNGVW